MLRPKAPLITRADYEDLPEGPPHFQVIEGDLVISPSPATDHQIIAGRIYSTLLYHVDEHQLGEVFVAPLDVFLSDTNTYQPDVTFVSADRQSIITEQGIEGAPNLVVEVLSPSSAKYDKGAKRKIYARTGVQELWLVDPDAKSIQVFDLEKNPDTPAATHGAGAVFNRASFPV